MVKLKQFICFSVVVDADDVVIASTGQQGTTGLQTAYFLVMELLKIDGLPAALGVDHPQPAVPAPTRQQTPLPLHRSDPLLVVTLPAQQGLFPQVIVGAQLSTHRTHCDLGVGRCELDGIDGFINLLEVVSSVECGLEFVVHCHVVEVEVVAQGHANEVALRPVEQVGVVVVLPSAHPVATQRGHRPVLQTGLHVL